MDIQNKITLKRFIAQYPLVSAGIKRGSKTFDEAIKKMSEGTKINETFLIQNIDRIRNWLD